MGGIFLPTASGRQWQKGLISQVSYRQTSERGDPPRPRRSYSPSTRILIFRGPGQKLYMKHVNRQHLFPTSQAAYSR
jgi:hypothetical protein